MHEINVDYKTKDNRQIILPKTQKGKEKKLNVSSISTLSGHGNYFLIEHNKKTGKTRAVIANYTNQRTFYSEENILNCDSFEKFQKWCDNFVETSTKEDIKEAELFRISPRKHIAYKEGDYFRVKLKKEYTYGRILMDVHKRTKEGMNYWDILMGRVLIIEMFHILTTRKDVSIEELKELKTFPSQHIMDNNFYYGQYEIIGNDKLPEIIKYPIMYGRNINRNEEPKLVFQCGQINKTIPFVNNNLIEVAEKPKAPKQLLLCNFRNNSTGFDVRINSETIKECIKTKSNEPYWNYYKYQAIRDLRSPINKSKLKKVLKQFGVYKDLIYYLADDYTQNNKSNHKYIYIDY